MNNSKIINGLYVRIRNIVSFYFHLTTTANVT